MDVDDDENTIQQCCRWTFAASEQGFRDSEQHRWYETDHDNVVHNDNDYGVVDGIQWLLFTSAVRPSRCGHFIG